MKPLAAFLAGLVFGLGLIAAGMADPAKVLAFLDLAGAWDPSLAFVMAGAIGVAGLGTVLARRRGQALLGGPLQLPAARGVDGALAGGSLVFGIGWGLSGFCPGPAVVAVGMGAPQALVFTAAMLAGMGLFTLLARRGPAS